MKNNIKWSVIDNMLTRGAVIYSTPYETKEAAETAARIEWERMTEHDRKKRDAFFVELSEYDKENNLIAYLETGTIYK